MDLLVKQMDTSHIDEVLYISQNSFPVSWSIESFEKELTNPLAKYMVAILDNKVIGFAGLWTILDEGHITNIAIDSSYRGKGYSKILLSSLLENTLPLCSEGVTLEVRKSNIVAQNLYTSLGFISEGVRKGYYEDNKEDAIIMWKRPKKD